MCRAVSMCLLLVACGELGLPGEDKDNSPDPETPEPPVDTDGQVDGPVLPCDVPEEEPNDTLSEGGVLPLEALGCGTFAAPNDGDHWTVDVPEESWVDITLRRSLSGSDADLRLFIVGPGDTSNQLFPNPSEQDIHFSFPSSPGTFELIVSQPPSGAGSGDNFSYEIRASVSKPPLEFTMDEGENDSQGTAQLVSLGASGQAELIQGSIGDSDQDWFGVAIPVGTHEVTAQVYAFGDGSKGDFALSRFDGNGELLETRFSGLEGFDPDPYLSVVVPGPQVLYFRVTEQQGLFGPMFWYGLSISLEEQ